MIEPPFNYSGQRDPARIDAGFDSYAFGEIRVVNEYLPKELFERGYIRIEERQDFSEEEYSQVNDQAEAAHIRKRAWEIACQKISSPKNFQDEIERIAPTIPRSNILWLPPRHGMTYSFSGNLPVLLGEAWGSVRENFTVTPISNS